jgi:hypothetical protein
MDDGRTDPPVAAHRRVVIDGRQRRREMALRRRHPLREAESLLARGQLIPQ